MTIQFKGNTPDCLIMEFMEYNNQVNYMQHQRRKLMEPMPVQEKPLTTISQCAVYYILPVIIIFFVKFNCIIVAAGC